MTRYRIRLRPPAAGSVPHWVFRPERGRRPNGSWRSSKWTPDEADAHTWANRETAESWLRHMPDTAFVEEIEA